MHHFKQERKRFFASILKKQDYNSSFFHGGKNGTMNFDGYASAVGFEKYVGLNEFKFIYWKF